MGGASCGPWRDYTPEMLFLISIRLSSRRLADAQQFLLVVIEAVQTGEVTLDAPKDPLRDFLALRRLAEHSFIGGVAQEGDFCEHRRHIRANQNHERRFFHATVFFLHAD